jgi:hypothetical protein
MRLPDAGIAIEEKSLLDDGKLLDETNGFSMRGPLSVRVYLEVTELAMCVAARNASVLEQ